MLQEFEYDVERGANFIDPRLISKMSDIYLQLLRVAIQSGTAESFSDAIDHHHLLKEEETRQVGEKTILAKVPKTANHTLGEGEFNRYYMRAICLQAIKLGHANVEIYRAKPVQTARREAQHGVGTFKNAAELLQHLRATNISVDGVFPGANSGKSVRMVGSPA
ncbi:MAG: hypothetical protein WD740_03585 [Anaerolineales bacterium]